MYIYISIKVEEDRRQLEMLRELQLQHDLQQKTNQYNEQGDTEYLPAIDEALSLLIEKEEIFKEKCLHLGKNIYS